MNIEGPSADALGEEEIPASPILAVSVTSVEPMTDEVLTRLPSAPSTSDEEKLAAQVPRLEMGIWDDLASGHERSNSDKYRPLFG
ncbi:hypothetical protein E4U14_002685 [Claviceps sp. LM454 group G7]|nr:hypothetical protein E4U14_002685 [Claviceps sp. LM454 group G7]